MNVAKKVLSYFQIFLEQDFIRETLLNEKRKIYHYHIRKTGGTSINHSFFHQSAYDNVNLFFRLLNQKSISHRLVANGKIFVSWNRFLLNKGQYFYGYSHHPMHILNIPEDVFKITSFRDPVKRFVSHYNMLRYFQKEKTNSKALKDEGKYLGNSIVDFANNIPKKHLKTQIYMFSKKMDYHEATENILNNCDYIIRTEKLNDDLQRLERILDISLPSNRQRAYGYKEEISSTDLNILRGMLDDEYRMLEKVFSEFAKRTDEQIILTAQNKFSK